MICAKPFIASYPLCCNHLNACFVSSLERVCDGQGALYFRLARLPRYLYFGTQQSEYGYHRNLLEAPPPRNLPIFCIFGEILRRIERSGERHGSPICIFGSSIRVQFWRCRRHQAAAPIAVGNVHSRLPPGQQFRLPVWQRFPSQRHQRLLELTLCAVTS